MLSKFLNLSIPQRLFSILLKIGFILFCLISLVFVVFYFKIYSILIITGVMLSVVVFLNPYWGLFIIIIIFPFMVGFSEGIDIMEKIFIGLFIFWLTGWFLYLTVKSPTRINLNLHPIFKPSLALGILFVASAIIGLLRGATFLDIFRDLSRYVGYLVIFPVTWIIKKKEQAFKLLLVLLIIGLPCWIWSAFIWWSRKFGLEYGAMNIVRIGSAYFEPFIGALWPFFILRTKQWMKILAGILLLLLGFYSIISGYRSMVINFFAISSISIIVLWIIQKEVRKVKIIFPMVVVISFTFWFYYGVRGYLPLPWGDKTRKLYISLISPRQFVEDISIQGRLLESKVAIETFKKYPIIGQGFGQHLEIDWPYGRWYKTAYSQHIWHTEILSKFGLIGVLIFLWYIISVLIYLFTTAKKINNYLIKAFVIGILIWIAKSLIPGVGSWSNRGFTFTVGIILGILPAINDFKIFNINFKKNYEK